MVAGGSELTSVELIDLTFGSSPIGLSCRAPCNEANSKVDEFCIFALSDLFVCKKSTTSWHGSLHL